MHIIQHFHILQSDTCSNWEKRQHEVEKRQHEMQKIT